MGSCQIGRSDDGTQVVRVLDSIQKENKRIFPSFFRQSKHILDLTVTERRNRGDHSLMMSGLTHLVQSFFRHKIYHSTGFFCFTQNRHNRTVLTSSLHKQTLDQLFRPKSLQHAMASLYAVFIVIFFSFTVIFISHFQQPPFLFYPWQSAAVSLPVHSRLSNISTQITPPIR